MSRQASKFTLLICSLLFAFAPYALTKEQGEPVAEAAGADLKAKNKQGLTAFELAKQYNHATMASLLAGKIASQ